MPLQGALLGALPLVVLLVSASPDEYRLIQDLKVNYDPVERPVGNHSEPLKVTLRLHLQQIVDVDEKNQVLTLVLWRQTKWNDYKMRWDPAEYGGVRKLQLPTGTLWKPDILLFNSADENFDAAFAVNYVVEYNGDIEITPPGIVKVSCPIDITWFPYDDQVCKLKYGTWTYNGLEVDLRIDDVDLTEQHQMDLLNYVENGEWDLLATPAKREAIEFGGVAFVELNFFVHMKRKTLYYGLNWIVPSILISLSNVLGFTLTPECGEKITLQITNLLSVTVFLGMVSEITPPTSESIPVIAVFFSISMLLLGCSIVVTILIINIFFRNHLTHKMPNWMRLVFLEWLPWLFLMSRPGKQFTRPAKEGGSFSTESSDLSSTASSRMRKLQIHIHEDHAVRLLDGGVKRLIRQESDADSATGPPTPIIPGQKEDVRELQKTVKDIAEMLRLLKERVEEEDEEDDAQADWRFAAMVLDRISLYLFTALFIITIIFLVFTTPRIFDKSTITYDTNGTRTD